MEYIVTDNELTSIADAIRLKNGNSTLLEFPNGFANAIENISQTSSPTTIESLSVTQNGTYTAASGKAYSPVIVNVQEDNFFETEINVENETLVYDNTKIDVQTQPIITNDEIAADDSNGMTFAIKSKILITFEFDYTIEDGSSGGIVLSFGGSNTYSGVFVIKTTYFQFFAYGSRFTKKISIIKGVKHHCIINLTPSTVDLYVDGELAASGESVYCQNTCLYILNGSYISVMYNQSAHNEYVQGTLDNLIIKMQLSEETTSEE